jgi:hypothetical protein
MTEIANLAIATAVAAQVTPWLQFRDGPPETVELQANFAYGSGGATVSAWIQTSFDGGLTAEDVANFSFTTSSLREEMNVSSLVVVAAPAVATDGTLGANSASGTFVGSLLRVKWTSTGTYAGGTTLRIDATPNRGRLTSFP